MNEFNSTPGDAFDRMRIALQAWGQDSNSVAAIKRSLSQARRISGAAVRQVESSIGHLNKSERHVLVDLFFAYRGVEAWNAMIDLNNRLPEELAHARIMKEQVAFALNRAGHSDAAEYALLKVLNVLGPSSEVFGLLGRVYKDRWQLALRLDHGDAADGLLDKAIEYYVMGTQVDQNDIYPGVNALTLMELGDRPTSFRQSLLPRVRTSAELRAQSESPDYWDHATLLEIALITKDQRVAQIHLGNALRTARERWELQTTARNLGLLRTSRESRGDIVCWAQGVELALLHGRSGPKA